MTCSALDTGLVPWRRLRGCLWRLHVNHRRWLSGGQWRLYGSDRCLNRHHGLRGRGHRTKRRGHGAGLPVGLDRHGLWSVAAHQSNDEQKQTKRQATEVCLTTGRALRLANTQVDESAFTRRSDCAFYEILRFPRHHRLVEVCVVLENPAPIVWALRDNSTQR